MIVEKRTLPIGVEYEGKQHRELELRPRLVRDLVSAYESPLSAKSGSAFEVCSLAGQILKLGEIPKEAITGELLMEMHSDDFDVLTEAAEKARQRAREFRSKTGDSQ